MIIWSLFDGSGLMGLPWALAGHEVYCFNADEGNHGAYAMRVEHPHLHYVNVWIDDDFMLKVSAYPLPDILFAFPDCTMLSGAGNVHTRSSDDIRVAVGNALRVEHIANQLGIPWMVENPVGKMSKLWRKPDHYFHPFEYGGYLSGYEEQFHPRMPRLDAYTKKTCIWCGNGFVMPPKKPVPHIGLFWGWAYLGGKHSRTNNFVHLLRVGSPVRSMRLIQNDYSRLDATFAAAEKQ